MNINVIIAEKHALAMPHEALVCGNSDYVIEFKFDEEWDKHPTKTARFIFDDRSFTDVVFNGTLCPVPVLTNTHEVLVGVFAGDLKTTTPAYLRSQRSILCYGGEKAEVSQELYDQIMQYVNDTEYRVKIDAQNAAQSAEVAQASAQTASDKAEAADKSEQNAGYYSSTASEQAESAMSSAASASKSAQESAQSASDAAESAHASNQSAESAAASAEAARESVESIPGALPNPHKLTFRGGASGEYDGSSDTTVEIPDVMVVHVVKNDSGAYVVDKPVDEIKAAIRAKRIVLMSEPLSGMMLYSDGEPYNLRFHQMYYNGSTVGFMWYSVTVNADGTVRNGLYTDMTATNPQKLKFTGAVTAEYDGDEAVTVHIPTGVTLTVDADGNATL